MAKFWEDDSAFTGLQEGIDPDTETELILFAALPSPVVLERTLLWWEARWWNTVEPGLGTASPVPWEFRVLAIENDTGEPPPPSPDKPIMRGMITGTGPGVLTVPFDESTTLFNYWTGFSGAVPMESKSRRAAVNYSGGMLLSVRFVSHFPKPEPTRWWRDGFWSLYFKIACEFNDPSS